MPTRKHFFAAIVALYGLALVLPAIQGHLHPNESQWPHFDPTCALANTCESVSGIDLSIGGLLAFVVLGIGFSGAPLAESSWLANPLFLGALVFFVAKKQRTARWIAGCAVAAALLMLVPATYRDQYGYTMFGRLEIGYWCWLASIGTLFVASFQPFDFVRKK
jgi:hypothetical protein